MRFRDRHDAGRQLAAEVSRRYGGPAVVYVIPRGGVILGAAVARRLALPLDVVIVRKIVHPADPARTIAAVTEAGDPVLHRRNVADTQGERLRQRILEERREARRCRKLYTEGRPPPEITGKLAIVVDDGVLTGLSIQAAARELRMRRPERLIAAVPLIAKDVAERLAQEVDDLIVLDTVSGRLGTVAGCYDHFPRVSEQEVCDLLRTVAAGGVNRNS